MKKSLKKYLFEAKKVNIPPKKLLEKKRLKKRDAPVKRSQEKITVGERDSLGKLQPRQVAGIEVGGKHPA